MRLWESVKRLDNRKRAWWAAYCVAGWLYVWVTGIPYNNQKIDTGDPVLDVVLLVVFVGLGLFLVPGVIVSGVLLLIPLQIIYFGSHLLVMVVKLGFTTPTAGVLVFGSMAALLWVLRNPLRRALMRAVESEAADMVLAAVDRFRGKVIPATTEVVVMPVRHDNERRDPQEQRGENAALYETAAKLRKLAPDLPALPGQQREWKGWIAEATERFQMRQMHRSREVALMLLRQMTEYYSEWLKAQRTYDEILDLDSEREERKLKREDVNLERAKRRKELELEMAKLDAEMAGFKAAPQEASGVSREEKLRGVFLAQLKDNVALEKIREEALKTYPELKDRIELIYDDLRGRVAEGRPLKT